MRRILAIVACGLAVAGCASGSDALKSATPTLTLQFESEPAGAEVKTSNGQTCRTPCALAVPATDLTASYTLNGYKPQTVPVKLVPPDELRPDSEVGTTPMPRFDPSPVYVELEKAAPVRRSAPRRSSRPATAPSSAPATSSQQPPMPPPSTAPAPAPSTSSPWPSTTAPAPSGTQWPPAPTGPTQVR